MKTPEFKNMPVSPADLQEISKYVIGIKKVQKYWEDEKTFTSSKEVIGVYEGFQADYRSHKSCKFLGGFQIETGEVFRVYEALGVTLCKQLTVSSSLHNGGCYEICFIKTAYDELGYIVNNHCAYDMSKVRAAQKRTGKVIEATYVDVYDSSVM